MKYINDPPGLDGLGEKFDASAKRIVTVDVEKYQSFIDDADMTEAQKKEFLEALWAIIVNFVELGFGVHPMQQVCGQNNEKDADSTKSHFSSVSSDEIKECSHE